jgi:hypothetical protein
MYHYWVYGLVIHSNLEIPALPSLPGDEGLVSTADVFINFDPTIADFDRYNCPHLIYADLNEKEGVLFDRRYGLFILKEGREVLIQPSEKQDLNQIRLYILGTILTVLLYQRGILALHGSAMAIGDQVVGVIAPSGTGKSSTAAALYKRGHRLLSDDAVPIVFKDGGYWVYPGYPRLKISEEVAACLDYGETHIIEKHPECGEVSFDARHQFMGTALPLKQIYVLEAGDALDIQPCAQIDAVFGMMKNSLPTMWLQQHSPDQFKQCTDFAKSLPFYRMIRSQNLDDLPKLATMLESHFLNS